ncbi:hypothetical protein DFR50_10384 [Roseiarcus fermentans]|uniref:Secreted protein n=1 Tax=Roseiarcus fermentans TaxID=1473586 RepID=A0A366FU25_9HYPH|nr:hypothetical protein [Roseiarcus fermentans]RBP17199.1 hypothetical protein DFR50_10384 [Roseiarcus fermentans]
MKLVFNVGLMAGLLAASLTVAGAARADSFELNYEAPGVETSTATFSAVGVETFDTLKTGMNASFTAAFGATGITGTYSGPNGVQINSADQYGGAGGTGKYAVAFNSDPYTLTLNQNVNYFGYWLSALDAGNVVTFYANGVQVGQVSPGQVTAVTQLNKAYYGNPNANFKGQDSGESFAFINFYDTTGSFNQIQFSEAPTFGGGYESDNQTVGVFTKESAASAVVEAPLPLLGSSPIAVLVLAGAFLAAQRRSANPTMKWASVAA